MRRCEDEINTKHKCLADLPNQSGFEFIGITHDDCEMQCIVKKNSIGLHSIYSNDAPVYFQLKSWVSK